MKRILFYFFLILTLLPKLGAEEKTEVFAPFISRLKATTEESSIKLTWKSSADIKSYKQVYRHIEEISEANFSQSEFIARLAPDQNYYIDLPPDTSKYYYAVLLEDQEGNLYRLFIPFRNKTSLPVSVSRAGKEEDLAASVTNITAVVQGETIIVNFESSKPERQLLLFRSTLPVRSSEDLLRASSPVTLNRNSSHYRDLPIPGVDYYYTVIDGDLFKLGKVVLLQGENSTRLPVKIPLSSSRTGLPVSSSQLRPLPLPYLLIDSGVEQGEELTSSLPFLLPEQIKSLKPATKKAIAKIFSGFSESVSPEIQLEILRADQGGNSGGEGYALKGILQEQLLQGNFSQAEALFNKFLSIRRSSDIEARTHFYLAQSLYFQEKYREAFLTFLLAMDHNYTQIQPWLEACYQKLQQ